MVKQIINGRILTPQGWLDGGSVLVEGNKIVKVINTNLPLKDVETIDAKGCAVVPGGIEMHVHGGGGRDFMEGTEEAFRVAVDAHMKHGTTAIFPTLSSSTVPMIEAAVETCDKLMAEPDSPVMGLHLEGPYFNPAQAGAQIPEWIKPPVATEYEPLLEKSKCLRRWPVVYKNREFKVCGTVESIFAEQNMTVEMIADGIHVPPVMLRMIYQIKGVENTALITDALACSASDENTAFDPRVIVEDGVCKLADHSALAGSIATTDRLIRTMVQKADVPLADAARMASETPARIMNVYDRKGSLQKGKDADIIIMDKDLQVQSVWAMGKPVS